jgi:hypothetical protein
VSFVCERERWGRRDFCLLATCSWERDWVLHAKSSVLGSDDDGFWRLAKQGVVARYLGREYHPLHLHIPHANHELLIPGACVGTTHTLFLCPANAHAAVLPLLLPSQMSCDGLLLSAAAVPNRVCLAQGSTVGMCSHVFSHPHGMRSARLRSENVWSGAATVFACLAGSIQEAPTLRLGRLRSLVARLPVRADVVLPA